MLHEGLLELFLMSGSEAVVSREKEKYRIRALQIDNL